MNIECIIRIMAGSFILVSLTPGMHRPLYHSSHWLWVTAFIGFNLLQSGIKRSSVLHYQ